MNIENEVDHKIFYIIQEFDCDVDTQCKKCFQFDDDCSEAYNEICQLINWIVEESFMPIRDRLEYLNYEF